MENQNIFNELSNENNLIDQSSSKTCKFKYSANFLTKDIEKRDSKSLSERNNIYNDSTYTLGGFKPQLSKWEDVKSTLDNNKVPNQERLNQYSFGNNNLIMESSSNLSSSKNEVQYIAEFQSSKDTFSNFKNLIDSQVSQKNKNKKACRKYRKGKTAPKFRKYYVKNNENVDVNKLFREGTLNNVVLSYSPSPKRSLSTIGSDASKFKIKKHKDSYFKNNQSLIIIKKLNINNFISPSENRCLNSFCASNQPKNKNSKYFVNESLEKSSLFGNYREVEDDSPLYTINSVETIKRTRTINNLDGDFFDENSINFSNKNLIVNSDNKKQSNKIKRQSNPNNIIAYLKNNKKTSDKSDSKNNLKHITINNVYHDRKNINGLNPLPILKKSAKSKEIKRPGSTFISDNRNFDNFHKIDNRLVYKNTFNNKSLRKQSNSSGIEDNFIKKSKKNNVKEVQFKISEGNSLSNAMSKIDIVSSSVGLRLLESELDNNDIDIKNFKNMKTNVANFNKKVVNKAKVTLNMQDDSKYHRFSTFQKFINQEISNKTSYRNLKSIISNLKFDKENNENIFKNTWTSKNYNITNTINNKYNSFDEKDAKVKFVKSQSSSTIINPFSKSINVLECDLCEVLLSNRDEYYKLYCDHAYCLKCMSAFYKRIFTLKKYAELKENYLFLDISLSGLLTKNEWLKNIMEELDSKEYTDKDKLDSGSSSFHEIKTNTKKENQYKINKKNDEYNKDNKDNLNDSFRKYKEAECRENENDIEQYLKYDENECKIILNENKAENPKSLNNMNANNKNKTKENIINKCSSKSSDEIDNLFELNKDKGVFNFKCPLFKCDCVLFPYQKLFVLDTFSNSQKNKVYEFISSKIDEIINIKKLKNAEMLNTISNQKLYITANNSISNNNNNFIIKRKEKDNVAKKLLTSNVSFGISSNINKVKDKSKLDEDKSHENLIKSDLHSIKESELQDNCILNKLNNAKGLSKSNYRLVSDRINILNANSKKLIKKYNTCIERNKSADLNINIQPKFKKKSYSFFNTNIIVNKKKTAMKMSDKVASVKPLFKSNKTFHCLSSKGIALVSEEKDNQILLLKQKNSKKRICSNCNFSALYDGLSNNFYKCLNCLEKVCRHCHKDCKTGHFYYKSTNRCKILYRKEINNSVKRLDIIVKENENNIGLDCNNLKNNSISGCNESSESDLSDVENSSKYNSVKSKFQKSSEVDYTEVDNYEDEQSPTEIFLTNTFKSVIIFLFSFVILFFGIINLLNKKIDSLSGISKISKTLTDNNNQYTINFLIREYKVYRGFRIKNNNLVSNKKVFNDFNYTERRKFIRLSTNTILEYNKNKKTYYILSKLFYYLRLLISRILKVGSTTICVCFIINLMYLHIFLNYILASIFDNPLL